MTKKNPPPVESVSGGIIRRKVTELQAVIQAAVALGWRGEPPAVPEQENLPSLDDHCRALGMGSPAPRATVHLRTRHAVQPVASALAMLINRGSFHGSALAELCANPEIANRAISAAERSTMIERGKFQLSVQQEATGGMHHLPGGGWDAVAREWIRPALGHHWITLTTKWLEPADIEEIMRAAGIGATP